MCFKLYRARWYLTKLPVHQRYFGLCRLRPTVSPIAFALPVQHHPRQELLCIGLLGRSLLLLSMDKGTSPNGASSSKGKREGACLSPPMGSNQFSSLLNQWSHADPTTDGHLCMQHSLVQSALSRCQMIQAVSIEKRPPSSGQRPRGEHHSGTRGARRVEPHPFACSEHR
jgi:hypothetical protein